MPLSCPRRRWSNRDGILTVDGYALRVIPTPTEANRAYTSMIQYVAVPCVPGLVWASDAGGAGGLFLGDIIVVGAADLSEIVGRMTRALATDPRFDWVATHGHGFGDIARAARDHLLAHELGHAIDCDRARIGSPACEGRADTIAGHIAARSGWCEGLGRLFFHAIGCSNAPACSHPSAEQRVDFYVTGRTLASRNAVGWP